MFQTETCSCGSSAGPEGHLVQPCTLLTLLERWCPPRTTVPSMHFSRALPALRGKVVVLQSPAHTAPGPPPAHAEGPGTTVPSRPRATCSPHPYFRGESCAWTEHPPTERWWSPGRGRLRAGSVWKDPRGSAAAGKLLLSWADTRLRVLKHRAHSAARMQRPGPILKRARQGI